MRNDIMFKKRSKSVPHLRSLRGNYFFPQQLLVTVQRSMLFPLMLSTYEQSLSTLWADLDRADGFLPGSTYIHHSMKPHPRSTVVQVLLPISSPSARPLALVSLAVAGRRAILQPLSLQTYPTLLPSVIVSILQSARCFFCGSLLPATRFEAVLSRANRPAD